MNELIGKNIFVTGASSGIGLAISKLFANNGAKIAMVARNEKRLENASYLINKEVNSNSTVPIKCDVTVEEQVINAIHQAEEELGSIDIVISNAGSIKWAAIQDTSLDIWDDMLRVHATGYFLVSREAIKLFIKNNQKGVIIFVISDNAIKPSKHMLAYNVAKACEMHMARCIADECGQYGIRINSILPGAVFGGSSFWTKEYRNARAKIHGFQPNNLEEEYKKNSALSVVIDPIEVAQVALFLASERSSKITGAAISIDGGGKTGYVR